MKNEDLGFSDRASKKGRVFSKIPIVSCFKSKKPSIHPNLNLLEVAFPKILPNTTSIFRKLRVLRRTFAILVWTILCIPVQMGLLYLPGNGKVKFVCFYWRNICRLMGLHLRVFGSVAKGVHQKTNKSFSKNSTLNRPVLYIANHSSWLDIPLSGGVAPGAFVAKEEVGTWPLISILCTLGRVLFVSRQRSSTGKEQIAMRERLREGRNLILFPEGTSSDGSHLLPFLSSFFVLAKPSGNKPVDYALPIIQPVSIVYDRLNMLPVNRRRRTEYSWFGDMELAPHFWQLGQWFDMRCTIVFHKPLLPENYKTRKELAQTTWEVIAEGTATLRQAASEDKIQEIISTINQNN